MANEIARQEDNFFSAYGKLATQSMIVGKLLRFTKGDYVAGQDMEEVAIGTRLVVNMDSILIGWQRWEDQRPAEQAMGLLVEGFQPPRRDALGFTDQSQWEVDDRGQPRDPWQESNVVLMKDPESDELYTFTAASKGSIGAVQKLCAAYSKEMRERSGEYPVIELGVDSYMHSNKAFGRIKFPVLGIVDWTDKSEFEVAPEASEPKRQKPKDTSTPAPKKQPKPVKVAAAKAKAGPKRLTARSVR